jgi:hypothetical protein
MYGTEEKYFSFPQAVVVGLLLAMGCTSLLCDSYRLATSTQAESVETVIGAASPGNSQVAAPAVHARRVSAIPP